MIARPVYDARAECLVADYPAAAPGAHRVDRHLLEFAAQRLERAAEATLAARPLYAAYASWCAEASMRAYSETLFGRRVKETLALRVRRTRARLYCGLRLISSPPPAVASAAQTPAGIVSVRCRHVKPGLAYGQHLWQPWRSPDPPRAGEVLRWTETAWEQPARIGVEVVGENEITAAVEVIHRARGRRRADRTLVVIASAGDRPPAAGARLRRSPAKMRGAVQLVRGRWRPIADALHPLARFSVVKWREPAVRPIVTSWNNHGSRTIVAEVVEVRAVAGLREHDLVLRVLCARGWLPRRRRGETRRAWAKLRRIESALARWPFPARPGLDGLCAPRASARREDPTRSADFAITSRA